jgi:predicted GNAT family acetyltransferase
MDFLRRIGRFIGGAAQNVGRAFQQAPQVISRSVLNAQRAQQQAVQQVQRNLPRFQAPPPPRIQLPQIQIPKVQLPQIQLPQAPRVDLGAVSRALGNYYNRTALSQVAPGLQKELPKINRNVQSFNERLLGGLGRTAIRTGEFVLPGKTENISEAAIRRLFPEAGSTAGRRGLTPLADPRSFGGRLGTGAKAAVDVAGIVLPSTAATKGLQATQLAQRGMQGGRLARLGTIAATEAVGGIPASLASIAQARGQQKPVDLKKEIGIGLAIDAATPLGIKLLGKGYKAIRGALSNVPSAVIEDAAKGIRGIKPQQAIQQAVIAGVPIAKTTRPVATAAKAAQVTPTPRPIAENVYPIKPGVGRVKPPAGSVVDATPGLAERAQVQFAKSKKLPGEVATAGLDATFQLGTPGNIQKYVLDAKGNPVGGIVGFYEGPNRAILRNIYVLPGQRGQGAASKLIKAFEEEARINGISEIKLASKADKLYKKLGYQIDTSRSPGFNTNYFTKTIQPPKPVLPVRPQQAIDNIPQVPQKPIFETVPESAMQPKGPKGEIVPPKSSVQTVIDALAEAKPIRGKQEALYSAERARRAARVAAMGEKVQGEKGFFAQLGQLKGELPKAQFEGIRKQITQPVVDDLFNQIEKSNISVFEKVTAKQGLAKLLGAEGGVVPTRGELSLLNEVFPKELTQAILAKRTVMQKLGSVGGEIINLPRSIMSTVDLSAPFRQGIFMIGRPKQFIPAVGQMIKYAGSEKAYQGLQAQLRSRPTYQLMRQSRLALTDIDAPLLGREEAFMSNLAEKIPGFGILARGSDRAYTGFLNKLRADVFDDLLTKAKTTGAINDNPQIADDIANFVNAATGRGKLPNALEKSAVALNGIFFSPRLMASRLNLLNPVYYVKLDPFVRKEALKSLFTFAATGASVLGLAKAGGADVGVDPRSSDFGKIKIGNTRYDPWGGFQQYMVLASRLISGEMISSTTGKQMKLGESFKDPTRLDIIQRFLESKQAPIASFVTGFLKGKTTTGENFNLPAEVVDRFMPMMTQDMYDLYKEYGSKGIAMGIPGIFGFGSQTYQDQIPVKTKTKSGKETTTWRQAPSLGEEILNKLTGKQITNVPQEQIAGLQEQKKKETQYKIDLDKVKAQVLESGETQTLFNPVKNTNVEVYLKDGVVTTKDIKPKQAKTPKIKALKGSRARVARGRRGGGRGRVAKVKAPRVSIPKVSVKGLPSAPKAKKVSFKVPKPKATARKSIKIKTG